MEENYRDLPQRQGMYDPANEHDACGVGFIVNIKGERSYDIVYDALDILENLKHRGGEGADHKSGDGAGIMVQIPHAFLSRSVPGSSRCSSEGAGTCRIPWISNGSSM